MRSGWLALSIMLLNGCVLFDPLRDIPADLGDAALDGDAAGDAADGTGGDGAVSDGGADGDSSCGEAPACVGSKIMKCGAVVADCLSAALCNASGCSTPTCTPGSTICSGTSEQKCNPDGTGYSTITCSLGCGSKACLLPVQLAGDAQTACVRLSDSTVRCWGRANNDNAHNAWSKIGDGATKDRAKPTPVIGLTKAEDICVGSQHACAISGGAVYCWGWNQFGQLGDGTSNDASSPTTALGITNATQLACGAVHTCAVLATGSVKCWGSNANYQLGDGTMTPYNSPHTVALASVTSLACTNQSCCAVDSGQVKCWGSNSNGQLAEPSSTPSAGSPALTVPTLSSIGSLSAHGDTTCALSSAGAVSCWGGNSAGTVGNGTASDAFTPQPLSLAAVSLVRVGAITCAMNASGANCWGTDLSPLTTSPTLFPSLAGLTDLVSDGGATNFWGCAVIGADVLCAGDNAYGQLGDSTTTGRSSWNSVRWL